MSKRITVLLIFTLMFSSLYISEAVNPEPILTNRLMSLGSQGLDVKEVQKSLNQLGYSLQEDGIYGPGTQGAVLHFQRNYTELSNVVYMAQIQEHIY